LLARPKPPDQTPPQNQKTKKPFPKKRSNNSETSS